MFVHHWMITQIILEMLPISSSGHLMLAQYYLIGSVKKPDSLQRWLYYASHLITAFIVCCFFYTDWLRLARMSSSSALLIWVMIVDGITALFFYNKKYITGFPLWLGFGITALSLGATAFVHPSKIFQADWCDALIFGCVQSLALLPGVSRLAITTACGTLLGYCLFDAFILSWLVHLPLMSAAGIYGFTKLAYHIPANSALQKIMRPPFKECLLLGAAGLVSACALACVLKMVVMSSFYLIGWYMLLPIALAYTKNIKEDA